MDTTKDTAPADVTVTFEELGRKLGLEGDLLKGLADMGYTHPTPVQAQAIPAVATGRDLMAQARTGTGKTLAFGLPTLQRIDRTSPDTQVLVICPTRELAVQVADEIGRVSKYYQIIVAVVFGGVKVIDQVDEMQWAPIVVGTPGRLRDMIERGYLHLDTCKVVVLDEADEMLDMGFKDDLEFILGKCPKEKQTLLFSATFPPEITRIAHKYMRDPEKIEVSSGYTAATGLQHKFARVPKDKKVQALATLLRQPEMTSSIVFCETKTESAWVFQRLKREGFNIGIITGDVPQEKRLQTLQGFRDGELNVLVATDVAARGLDIPSVSHVFHFTVPRETATYVHRSGRTARAGRKGIAFTLVTPEEDRDFQRIMRDIKQGQPGAAPAAAPQGGRAGREEGRREGGREGREPREAREGREPREVREGGRREERGDRALASGREEGRERGRDRNEGRERGRDRHEGREGREGRAPQRHFVPGPVAPEGVGEAITRLGGRHTDEFVSVANSLLMQVDAPRLVAALLSQNPRAVSLLEAAQSGGRAAASPERGERTERGERERGPRDRNNRRGRDRDRGPRFEREDAPRVRYTAESYGGPELEAARDDRFGRDEEPPVREARPAREPRESRPAREGRTREVRPAREAEALPVREAAEAPRPERPRREVRPARAAASEPVVETPVTKPAAKAAAKPAAKPVSTPAPAAVAYELNLDIEAPPATVHTRRAGGRKLVAATSEGAPAPAVAAEEAPKAKTTRTRKAAAPKAEAPAAVVEAPAEKPKATRTRKAAAPKAEAPAAEAPAEEKPKAKRATTSRAKKATT